MHHKICFVLLLAVQLRENDIEYQLRQLLPKDLAILRLGDKG
jgi:hypothetical protein